MGRAGSTTAAVALGLGLAVTACGSAADGSDGTTAPTSVGTTDTSTAAISAPTSQAPPATSASTSEAPPVTSASTSEAPPVTSASTSEAPPADAVGVYFAVSGGVAGVSRTITISPDGTVERIDRGVASQGTIDSAQAAEIRADLDRSGLFDKNHRYEAPPGSADLFRYEIRYRGVTVVADETEVPPELSEAVASLRDALDQ